jgi:hypothetical protein
VRFLAVLLTLPLAACGAGVIGGVFASNRGRQAPEVRATAITVDVATAAFVDQEPLTRRLFISDFGPGVNAAFRVLLRVALAPDAAPSLPIEQLVLFREPAGPNLTTVEFVMSTAGLLSRVIEGGRTTTEGDFPAQLEVTVDDALIAPPVPFTVLRQPSASLVPSRVGANEEFVSVAGGDRITVRVSGQRSAAAGLSLNVLSANPQGGNAIAQAATLVNVQSIPDSEDVLVSGVVPAGTFPTEVFAIVRDRLSGSSLATGRIFYRPAGSEVSPRIVNTDGTVRVSLFGSGLVPLRFPANQRDPVGEIDYDQLAVFVERGGRRVPVPPAQIQRVPPSLTRLNFEVPASPDGRTGPANLVLQAWLLNRSVLAESRMVGAIVYGDSAPIFGARGAPLANEPVHFAIGDVDAPGQGQDCALTFGDVPRMQFLASLDNGMLRRFGAPILAGSFADPRQRTPQRVVFADWTEDLLQDLIVLNRGDGIAATHNAIASRPAPEQPWRALGSVVGPTTAVKTFVAADLNGDRRVDLVLVPPTGLGLSPEVCFARAGVPAFDVVRLDTTEDFEVVDVADFDADTFMDVALGRGGSDPQVTVFYGLGSRGFISGQTMTLRNRIPEYADSIFSTMIGLHACGADQRSLALAFSGRPSPASPPTLTVLAASGTRSFAAPEIQSTRAFRNEQERWAVTTTHDFDGDGVEELVVSNRGDSFEATVRVFRWSVQAGGVAFREIADTVDPGAGPLFGVTALAGGIARGANTSVPRRALFVTHKLLGGDVEDRISTYLVQGSAEALRFDAADASRNAPFDIHGVALGRFASAGSADSALDVVVATDGVGTAPPGLQFYDNDGLGVLTPGPSIELRGIAATLTALPLDTGAAALMLDRERRMLVVPRGTTSSRDTLAVDLSPYLREPALRALPLDPSSRIAAGDVDGDGVADAVLLLVFQASGVPIEDAGQLLLLRGRQGAARGELPFQLPDPDLVRTVSAHGDARDLAIGDLSPEAPDLVTRREVAVAVGGQGNHVRFYRFNEGVGAAYELVRSIVSGSEPVVTAGDRPVRVALGDVDSNGTVDLAVATNGDRRLYVFANLSLARRDGEVDVAAFRPIALNVRAWESSPTALRLLDINGDAALDVLVTQDRPRTLFSFQLGSGSGVFTDRTVVPSIRTGELIWDRALRRERLREQPGVTAIGEMNGDDALDVVFGWPFAIPPVSSDRNLRVLFGSAR